MSIRRSFTFPGQAFLFTVLSGAFLLFSCLGVLSVRNHDIRGLALAGIILLFVLLIGTITLVGRSEILIDDEKISRRLFGMTLQTLRWDNVRVVRAFPVNVAGTIKRGINILPRAAVKGNLFPISKISFGGEPRNIELIAVLNHYIKLHGIDVQNSFDNAQSNSKEL